MKEKIVLLARSSESTRIVYNYLTEFYNIEAVVIEKPVSRLKLIKKRIKRNGLFRTLGQTFFQAFVQNLLRALSKQRKAEILEEGHLSISAIPEEKTFRVDSVNSSNCIDVLNKLNPEIVVVNGTRIIAEKVLKNVETFFINMHAGITPAYRGVHGAYWALVNKQPQLAGVTIHYIDEGIDTGRVIYQATIDISENDNFITYPYLQIKAGLPLLRKALENILHGNIPKEESLTRQSGLWFHPTIFQYFKYRITRKVR